jgi:hypothetical protein
VLFVVKRISGIFIVEFIQYSHSLSTDMILRKQTSHRHATCPGGGADIAAGDMRDLRKYHNLLFVNILLQYCHNAAGVVARGAGQAGIPVYPEDSKCQKFVFLHYKMGDNAAESLGVSSFWPLAGA